MEALAKARARGPLLWNLRVIGLGASLPFVLSYSFGSIGIGVLIPSVLVGLGWQVWLFRPYVYVTLDSMVLRGLWSDTTLPAQSVGEFRVERIREPLDYFSRAIKLTVR